MGGGFGLSGLLHWWSSQVSTCTQTQRKRETQRNPKLDLGAQNQKLIKDSGFSLFHSIYINPFISVFFFLFLFGTFSKLAIFLIQFFFPLANFFYLIIFKSQFKEY